MTFVTCSFKDHFSTHATAYAAHRPRYPAALAAWLASVAPGTRRALDVGAGTGQLAVLLASHFDEVVAEDASAAQIDRAEPHPRVDYRVAPCDRSGLEDASVDLVTVAQAVHWFPLERFYAEVERVLRPAGALALVSYGNGTCEVPAVAALVEDFYRNVVGPYWPPERAMVEDGYRHLPFPFRERTDVPSFVIQTTWSLEALIGYLDTWSAVRGAEKALGASPIPALSARLAEAWPASRPALGFAFPLAVRVGHVA